MTIYVRESSVLLLQQSGEVFADAGATGFSFVPSNEALHSSNLKASLPFEWRSGSSLKRGIDIFISAAMLVLLAPLMFMVALIVYASMGGPVIFSHERVGFRGKRFRCYKFRTMVKDANNRLTHHLANTPEAFAEWQATHKLRNDPRITRLGKLLRKSSIDELPQLFNILRGDMTCVGPRPVTAEELRNRYGRSARHYLRVRPGLTGLWQVSGRSNTSYQDRIVLDRSYVMSWSLWLDLKILAKTTSVVFRLRESA